MKHVAIYCRVSTTGQNLKSQEPDLKRWADAQSLPVKWYRDKATGRNMNRTGWKRLQRDLENGKVSKLVCWKIDRLGRTARELLALFDDLRRLDVDLICVAGGVSGLDTAEGRLMAGMVAQFAEYDNELRSERIRAGQRVARENGKTWGGRKPGTRIRVTDEAVKMIGRMSREGESKSAMARATGLSRPTVYAILEQAR
ncbi:MAG: recombinase family protein [Planctomycetales bacterium]|nr:recombinase family protein [Planctomycetales bacterium]